MKFMKQVDPFPPFFLPDGESVGERRVIDDPAADMDTLLWAYDALS
jgi:hypothetical protein